MFLDFKVVPVSLAMANDDSLDHGLTLYIETLISYLAA